MPPVQNFLRRSDPVGLLGPGVAHHFHQYPHRFTCMRSGESVCRMARLRYDRWCFVAHGARVSIGRLGRNPQFTSQCSKSPRELATVGMGTLRIAALGSPVFGVVPPSPTRSADLAARLDLPGRTSPTRSADLAARLHLPRCVPAGTLHRSIGTRRAQLRTGDVKSLRISDNKFKAAPITVLGGYGLRVRCG